MWYSWLVNNDDVNKTNIGQMSMTALWCKCAVQGQRMVDEMRGSVVKFNRLLNYSHNLIYSEYSKLQG